MSRERLDSVSITSRQDDTTGGEDGLLLLAFYASNSVSFAAR